MYWIVVILALPYLFILISVWKHLKKIKQHESGNNQSLFISIIVPCKNEQFHLPYLLNDLALQEYPTESFEVVVVDDNSNDDTFNIASRFNGIRNFSVIKNSGTGKKSAILTGVKHSEGQVIITTDADCSLKQKWLRSICSNFLQNDPDLLISPVCLEKKPGFFDRFQELEFLGLQGITAGSAMLGKPVMCNGANLAFKKETYLRHTDFMHNEILSGDDIFFLHSLKKEKGSKIMWNGSPDAIVKASSAGSPGEYFKQRKRWLSKGKAYSDRDTIILAIVTFFTNLLIIGVAAASLADRNFLMILVAVFMLKAIPDFLILSNTSKRYGRMPLLKWFLPSEAVYPFYMLGVAIVSLFPGRDRMV